VTDLRIEHDDDYEAVLARDGKKHVFRDYHAYHGTKHVGKIQVVTDHEAGHLEANHVQVHPEHRRKGVATALYKHVETDMGRKFKPSSSQTDAGKALWDKTRDSKPFGEAKLPAGYTVKTSDEVVSGKGWEHRAEVHHDGKKVGFLRAYSSADHTGEHVLRTADVHVHPDHRRKGLATAMYKALEKHSGKEFVRSGSQTEDGEALWAQKKRPFGKDESTRAAAILGRLPASESLDPRFFGAGDQLDPQVRSRLLAVADDALSTLKDWGVESLPVQAKILTGSETSGDYDEFSDLDLHLVVDLSKSKDPKVLKNFLDAIAKNYNGKGLKIGGRSVEIYFQDASAELVAPGVYDLVAGAWAKHPGDTSRHEPSASAVALAQSYADQARALRAEFDSSDQSQLDQVRGYQERARALLNSIKTMRREGLAQGLYSDGNIAFKLLRRNGGFDALSAVTDGAKKALLGDG
jgi:GNAT superfamily N-acetyltransferase